MVDQDLQRTNHLILTDFIPLAVKPYKQKSQIYRDLYVKEGLSAAQIAERLGCSKTVVLERLRAQGIKNGDGRRTNPENYRLHEAPYGFSKRGNQLIPNRAEMRICRLIVSLRARRERSTRQIAAELMKRGIKNRRGRVFWTHTGVGRIFKRWNGKV